LNSEHRRLVAALGADSSFQEAVSTSLKRDAARTVHIDVSIRCAIFLRSSVCFGPIQRHWRYPALARSWRPTLFGALLLRRASITCAAAALALLDREDIPNARCAFNLMGTVSHTNLDRALLPETAITAAVTAMREPVAH
jgi:hypothetical protein